MKLKMAENSLFAVLLRSRWWISVAIALALGALAAALLPEPYRVAGMLSGAPFAVIGAMAARRQWRLPSEAQVAALRQAVAALSWPPFAQALEQAFRRDGHAVLPGAQAPVDFRLERAGRTTLVCARRWKSARIGLQDLRALQAAREAADAADALYVGLGIVSESARPYAAEHAITIWQADELADKLRGLLPAGAAK